MKRREFMTLVGGAAAAWPLAARSQQAAVSRRVSVLMGLAETDPFTVKYVQSLRGALEKLGWVEGRNIQFSFRYAAGVMTPLAAFAQEVRADQEVRIMLNDEKLSQGDLERASSFCCGLTAKRLVRRSQTALNWRKSEARFDARYETALSPGAAAPGGASSVTSEVLGVAA